MTTSSRRLIQSGVDESATLVTGAPCDPKGLSRSWYVKPSVFADVRLGMSIEAEEIFGPVIALTGYDTEEDATRIASDPASTGRRSTSSAPT